MAILMLAYTSNVPFSLRTGAVDVNETISSSYTQTSHHLWSIINKTETKSLLSWLMWAGGKHTFQDTSDADTAMITINRTRETEKQTSCKHRIRLVTYSYVQEGILSAWRYLSKEVLRIPLRVAQYDRSSMNAASKASVGFSFCNMTRKLRHQSYCQHQLYLTGRVFPIMWNNLWHRDFQARVVEKRNTLKISWLTTPL